MGLWHTPSTSYDVDDAPAAAATDDDGRGLNGNDVGGGKDNETPSLSSSSSDDSSSEDYHMKRDPFFAFIPQTARWGCGILAGETRTVKRAVVAFPSWSVRYGRDTVVFYKNNPRTLFDEIISGFTVAIMQVPESIAFSFVAGVPPQSGLHATFWMATVTGLLGGKPGMISGAAGALAVVVDQLTIDSGALGYLTRDERLNVLYMTMFVCGIMQILFCIFRLAKLVRLIPETGMIGFMNGLAIIIFMAQLPAFQKCETQELFIDCQVNEREWLTFQSEPWVLTLTLVHVAACMIIMKFFPMIPKIGKVVPSSLIALLVGALFEQTLFRRVFHISTRTVGETATMSGELPQFDWPNVPTDPNTIRVILSYGITLATIGAVESVLTLQACNEITDTVPKVSDANQELFAQGLANALCGMFRAMGGDAMIGQSTINIMNGARFRVSSTTSGLFMLIFVVALSSFIEMLPVATLTGVLFMVVLSTFQWQTFHILRYGRLSDSGVILIVTLVAIFVNLAVAIAAGVIFSALMHAWDSGACVTADITHKRMRIPKIVNNTSSNNDDDEGGEGNYVVDAEEAADDTTEAMVKYVHVRGSIFFGSARHFIGLFSVADDPPVIVVDFKDALIIDHSAVAAIQGVSHRFAQAGKKVYLTNLPHKSNRRLHRTGDHDVLKSQIRDDTEFFDLETTEVAGGGKKEGMEIEVGQQKGDGGTALRRTSSMGSATGGKKEAPGRNYTNLGGLPMFHGPAEDVDEAIGEMVHEHKVGGGSNKGGMRRRKK